MTQDHLSTKHCHISILINSPSLLDLSSLTGDGLGGTGIGGLNVVLLRIGHGIVVRR